MGEVKGAPADFLETKLGKAGSSASTPISTTITRAPTCRARTLIAAHRARVVDHLGGNVRWISADPLRRDAMITGEHEDQALREVGPNLTNDACHLTSQSFQTSETAARLGERIQRAAAAASVGVERSNGLADSIESTHVFFTIIGSPETISTTSRAWRAAT